MGSDIFEIQNKQKNWLYFLKLIILVIRCGSILNFTVLIKKWFYLRFVLRGLRKHRSCRRGRDGDPGGPGGRLEGTEASSGARRGILEAETGGAFGSHEVSDVRLSVVRLNLVGERRIRPGREAEGYAALSPEGSIARRRGWFPHGGPAPQTGGES